MSDREKAIRLIEEEIRACELFDKCYGTIDLQELQNILTVLKEQEPVPPNLMQNIDGIWNTCKRCGHILKPETINAENQKWFFTFPKYCSECGQAVKWNDY